MDARRHLDRRPPVDYLYPSDPWENLGQTAQLYGLGMLFVCAAIPFLFRAARFRGGLDVLAAAASGAYFGLTGMHALLSGALGVPSPLYVIPVLPLLGTIAIVTLAILGVRAVRVSRPAGVAFLALVGLTPPFVVVATFLVAPALAAAGGAARRRR